MEIHELNETQLALLINIVTQNNTFAVASIPEGHDDYAEKGVHYAEVAKDVEYLAFIGFIEDLSNKPGRHHVLNDIASKSTGYNYKAYTATEMAFLMFQSYLDETEKEMKYKYSIN